MVIKERTKVEDTLLPLYRAWRYYKRKKLIITSMLQGKSTV